MLRRERAAGLLREAGIALTRGEAAEIEVADFGLSELEQTGLQIVSYVNTDRVCAKELVLFPWQLCPEHRHPAVRRQPGQGGDLPLPQGPGLPLHRGGADGPARRAHPARRRLHGLARDRARPGRPVDGDAEHAPLVPGRGGGGDRVGVLDPQHRRARHLHRPADPARDPDRRRTLSLTSPSRLGRAVRARHGWP